MTRRARDARGMDLAAWTRPQPRRVVAASQRAAEEARDLLGADVDLQQLVEESALAGRIFGEHELDDVVSHVPVGYPDFAILVRFTRAHDNGEPAWVPIAVRPRDPRRRG